MGETLAVGVSVGRRHAALRVQTMHTQAEHCCCRRLGLQTVPGVATPYCHHNLPSHACHQGGQGLCRGSRSHKGGFVSRRTEFFRFLALGVAG